MNSNVTCQETLHFSVKSPENITRLLVTILFEQSEYYSEYSSLWFDVFTADDSKGDALFARFLTELFPEGCTLDKPELLTVLDYALRYIRDSSECESYRLTFLKSRHTFWVYSKWDKKFTPCHYGDHYGIISDGCAEFFGKNYKQEYSLEALKKFILSNFEISSSMTTLQGIVRDFLKLEAIHFRIE